MKKLLPISLIVILVFIIIMAFDTRNSYKPKNYFNWFNSKGCSVSKWANSDEMIFNLNYRSKEYMALSELNGEEISKAKFNTSLKNFECCEHFLLKIFANDTVSEALSYKMKSEQDYYDRLRFLSSNFGASTYLINGDDTLDCTFSHFERAFKMRPYISMNLIFEKKNKREKSDMILVIEPTIFNAKELRFTIDRNTISGIPKLKL